MKIINSIIAWIIKQRIHQIELFMKYPSEVQNDWFKKLIEKGSLTEFGKDFSFKDIKSIQQFQNQVPVSAYDDLKPYIEKLKSGSDNVLWPGEIKWFAKSSGTTSDKSKYIPVSTESLELCHYNAGKDMLAIYCNNYPETSIFTGKSIGMGGSQDIHEINNKEYYTGDLSAILMNNLPFWAEFIRSPNLSVALMKEWEEKIIKMAKQTSKDNIVNISGVPSWSLLLFEKVLELNKKQYINEIWPEFEVFFHGGVNFSPYREKFYSFFSGYKPRTMETYNASEGFFALEDIPNSGELLLLLDNGIFYEFVPLANLNEKHPRALLLSEVEKNTSYALVITTNGGLWRYLIGDTIEFTSLNPYRIRITGRTKSFINIAGEELMVENADKAILEACNKTAAIINEYTAGPKITDNNEQAGHHWLIEFSKPPEDINFFAHILDIALMNNNSDYEAKRYKNMILTPPIVESVPEGTFYKWLKAKGKLGGQNKIPRLSNNSEIIKEIHNIIKN